ncbi:hypothetical protein HY439_02910 [Candidatus Microgenomates bacterium]|nr:hypothetical protein [Candidatus Microgenomates bacterium]
MPIFLFLNLAPKAFAQGQINVPYNIPRSWTTIETGIIPGIIKLLLVVSFIVALIFLLLGGISWITSGGNKEGVGKAKARVTYAILGLILALLSFFIVYTLTRMFGVRPESIGF